MIFENFAAGEAPFFLTVWQVEKQSELGRNQPLSMAVLQFSFDSFNLLARRGVCGVKL
jgi:hypothetical protein